VLISGFWRRCLGGARAFLGGGVLLGQGLRLASRSNSALVSDVCAAALRAFYNAPQRER